MKIIGIIAEFNPFHNGHEYIIRTAKELSGADFCVVAMSGDFVQRGEPAICDKYLRTRMALLSSADAVFELPCVFARASAEQFAYGGVALLSSLGCIDEFYFGSESGDTELLTGIAQILCDEPAEYKASLSNLLRSGLTFPTAREGALKEYLAGSSSELPAAVEHGLLSSPNNILGIEYCKAVLRLKAAGIRVPVPVAIRRQGSSYASSLPDTVADASALAIRNLIKEGRIGEAGSYIPSPAYEILSSEYGRSFPVYPDDFSSALYSDLLTIKSTLNIYSCKNAESGDSCQSEENITSHISDSQSAVTIQDEPDFTPDIPADLLNAIMKKSEEPISFTGLTEAVKTRNITYSAVSRALISLMLDTADIISSKHGRKAPVRFPKIPYARLLGIRKSSSALMRKINENAVCEIINKLADAKTRSRLLEADIRAARLYSQIVYQKFGTRLPDEYRKTIEII